MTSTNKRLQRIYLVSYVIVCSLTKWTRVGLSGNPVTMFQWYFYHQRLAVWYHVTSITCAIWMRRQLRARILSMWFLSTPNCIINVIQKALSCSNHLRALIGLNLKNMTAYLITQSASLSAPTSAVVAPSTSFKLLLESLQPFKPRR